MTHYAFFDADETVIAFKTMFEFKRFLNYQLLDRNWKKSCEQDDAFHARIQHMATTLPREEINRYYYSTLAGLRHDFLVETGKTWYQTLKNSGAEIFIKPTMEFMLRLRQKNVVPVIVSGSTDFILRPFFNELGINDILCSQTVVENGKLSGRLEGAPVIGKGKQDAIRAFARSKGADLAECYAVGDHASDFPMLEAVGFPYLVNNGSDAITAIARSRAWGVIENPALKPHEFKF
jgi:HAD superfamily hydrolase (TIGR01490 family)